MLKVTIESDVEGVHPITLVSPDMMYRNPPNLYTDTAQDNFTEQVKISIAELFCTERNKQRAPIE